MDALRLFALLIYTFGAFAYGAMLVMWVRELGGMGWATRRATEQSRQEADVVNGVMLVVTVAWFLVNVGQLLVGLSPQRRFWQLDIAGILIAFTFPALIMHVTWAEVAHEHPGLSRLWRVALWPAYVIGLATPAWFLAVSYWAVDGRAIRAAGQGATIGLSLAFIAAAVYCIALMSGRATPPSPQAATADDKKTRQAWWSVVGLFGGMALIFVFMIWVAGIGGAGSRAMATAGFLLEVIAKSLPLIFVFVSTYFENRFYFFDLLVKRGVAFLIAIGMLTVWLALTLPLLRPLADTWAAPWIYAVALMPVVAAIPWIYRHVAATLDRRWLGRRFTTVDALKHFVSALRPATSSEQAVERAQQALTDIFGAPAAVCLGSDTTEAAELRSPAAVASGGPLWQARNNPHGAARQRSAVFQPGHHAALIARRYLCLRPRQPGPAAAPPRARTARTGADAARQPLRAEGAARANQPPFPVQRAQRDRRADPPQPRACRPDHRTAR